MKQSAKNYKFLRYQAKNVANNFMNKFHKTKVLENVHSLASL